MRPLIGITLDEGTTTPRPGRPAMPLYELKQAYVEAVVEAGGIPLLLPYEPSSEALERYLSLIDGLVVTGGAFDIGPEEYGEEAREGMGPQKPQRTRFERAILEGALKLEIPVLGVCGGMQLLNVVLGGTLIQHIPDEVPKALAHEQAHDPQQTAHAVEVESDSLLASLVQVSRIHVNTTHHQAVAKLAPSLRISGTAPDGVVEAIEGGGGLVGESADARANFVLGVQWHPELLSEPASTAIYQGLIGAAQNFRRGRAVGTESSTKFRSSPGQSPSTARGRKVSEEGEG